MAPRFAYWDKTRTDSELAANPPARLLAAWPNLPGDGSQKLMFQRHPSGAGSMVIFPHYDGAGVDLDAFGEPIECADGLVFYPSKEAPSKDWLIRPEEARPAGEWVKTYNGEIHVAVAFAAPRALLLCSGGGMKFGASVSEFGRLGHDVYDAFMSKEGMPFTDPRLSRFLFLILRESYWVTEEIAEGLPWLTDVDIDPVILAALGCGPKRLADARGSSGSSALTTQTPP